MKLLKYLSEARELLKGWKNYVNSNKDLDNAVKILETINKKGYKAFIVGGTIRDILMGNDIHDVDLATNMPVSEIEKIWKTHDIGKSKDFGIVTININGSSLEISQFRTDGKYKDGRRPKSVTISSSFEDDAGRRDFTINAMGINAKGEIFDYFDGKKDIQNKVIRAVGDPRLRFAEDKSRPMRAARFASKLGFDIEKNTLKAAQKADMTGISYERVRDELFKAASLGGDKFAEYLEILDRMKILKIILPELVSLKYAKQNFGHHPEGIGEGGTVWAHVKAALKSTKTQKPLEVLAIALHDVGKSITQEMGTKGSPTYYGHAEKGMEMIKTIAQRLKLSKEQTDALVFSTGNHMKFHKIMEMTPSKVYKIATNDNFDVLKVVAKADEEARGKGFTYAGEFEKIVSRAMEIKNKYNVGEVKKRMKLVDGNHVMEITGLSPGPKVGEIIRKTTEWILDNDVKDPTKIDEYIKGLI